MLVEQFQRSCIRYCCPPVLTPLAVELPSSSTLVLSFASLRFLFAFWPALLQVAFVCQQLFKLRGAFALAFFFVPLLVTF